MTFLNPIHNNITLMKMYKVYALPKSKIELDTYSKVKKQYSLILFKTKIIDYVVDTIEDKAVNGNIYITFYSKDGIRVKDNFLLYEYGTTWLLMHKDNLKYININEN